MSDKNIQTFVIKVTAPNGKSWVVGTTSKRGFTKSGAEQAQAKLEAHLPHGWGAEEIELTPVCDVLAIQRRNRV